MRHNDQWNIFHTQATGCGPRQDFKSIGANGDSRLTRLFQGNRGVDTPRRTAPSVTDRDYNRIRSSGDFLYFRRFVDIDVQSTDLLPGGTAQFVLLRELLP